MRERDGALHARAGREQNRKGKPVYPEEETEMKDMKMLIGGQFVDASDGGVMKNYNPYTGELIGTVPAATKEDTDRAVANAVEGAKVWGAMRCDERDVILERFLALVEEHKEEIAQMTTEESGKTISESRSEVSLVPQIFHAYMHAASTMYGETLPLGGERRIAGDLAMTIWEPLGVCVCIAPFNYPISTMTNKVAPALCAGNSVIMKPASDTPMATLMYAKLMMEAGMPANVIQCVTGSGSKFGGWITANKDVAAISVTGSTQVGKVTMEQASRNLQKVLLELGGNDPLIIFGDADVDESVAEALNGHIYNAGQVCSGSKRFIVQNSVKEEFTAKLIEALRKVPRGIPTDDAAVYSCLINKAAADNILRQIQDTVALGAKLVCGGERTSDTIVEPAVLTDVTKDMPIAQDMEVFGPVFPIIGFDTWEEAVAIANNTCYGLSSGVMTGNMRTALRTAKALEAGTCVINGTGDYRTSYHGFGGRKMSGIGREGAIHTLEEFSETKTIVLRRML